jgi:hypothetical protein
MRTSAKINSDFKREKFVDTDKDDIDKKVYNEGSLKLIKSRLKFSDSLKMGVSSLKHKVGKLIFTILLSFVAFTIFGLVDTLSCWDRASSVYQTVEITNQKYVSIVKREKTDSYFEDTYTEDNDIEYLKNKFPNQFFKGIAGSSSYVSFFMDDEQIDLDNLDSDVYKQMLSYMFRFDSKIGKLLYPVSSKDCDKDEGKAKVLKLRRDSSIVLKTVPFVIPAYSEEDSFESFAKEMEQAEIGFIGNILER